MRSRKSEHQEWGPPLTPSEAGVPAPVVGEEVVVLDRFGRLVAYEIVSVDVERNLHNRRLQYPVLAEETSYPADPTDSRRRLSRCELGYGTNVGQWHRR